MKKLSLKNIGVLLVALLGLSSCYNQGTPREQILKVYNWGDYIDESLLDEFTEYYKKETGEDIQIIYQTFDVNEVMLTKIERGHEDFDVVCPSEYIIERMLKKDMLLPIDTLLLRKDGSHSERYFRNLSPFIRSEIDKVSQPGRRASDYAVSYMWGTAGILYNTKYVTEEEASTWQCLWGPKFTQKILMKESYRDAYGTALIYAYRKPLLSGKIKVEQLMNDYSPAAMDTVEKYLKLLKPNIAGWEADFGKETMTKGKAYINMTWSGDAVWAIDEAAEVGVDLNYVVPVEGSNVWYDGWVIPKYAKNRKAASYFINFLCRSDVALRNMDEIGYVSAVATPEILEAKIDTTLEDYSDLSYFFGPEASHVKVDPIQYPDKSVVERCAMIRDSGDKTEQVLEIWSRVKGDNLGAGITIFIFVIVGALSVWSIYGRIQRRKHNLASLHKSRRRKKG